MNEMTDLQAIYEEMMDNILFQESLKSKIGEVGKNIKDNLNIAKIWEKSKQVSKRKTWESNEVDDETFKKIQQEATTLRAAKTYFVYKHSFDNFCKLCNIPIGSGVVIMNYSFEKGKEPNKNTVKVQWADGKHKMTIPHGSILYHRSTNANIKELIPVFKGKAARGFLYDTPRVYVTIKANMPKLAADIYKKDGQTYMYIVDEDIKSAYVDPLLRSYTFGAVYVETRNPIKVKKLTPDLAEKIKNRFKD